MHAVCPNCDAFSDAESGQLTSCAQCGHWWIPGHDPDAPSDPALAEQTATAVAPRAVEGPPWEFELQLAEGDRWGGPFNRYTLREMLYVERLTGDEQIRVPGATQSERLGDRPEFGEVLELLGKTESTGAHRSSIAGWKKQAPAPAPTSAPKADAAASPASSPAASPAAAAAAPKAGGNTALLIGVAAVVVLAVGGVVAWLALG